MGLRKWLRRRRLERAARAAVDALFDEPERLRGTSLKCRHASRYIIVDFEASGDRVTRVRFGIVRHPRPYAFSSQAHKVIEHWVYDVEAGTIEVVQGLNLTRLDGEDACE